MSPLPAHRPPAPRGVRTRRSPLAVAVLAVAWGTLFAGCGLMSSTPPPATPTNFPGLAGRFNTAGISVSDWVSGDAGCSDPDLVPAAISFSAKGIDQSSPVRIYLYIFRDAPAFERHRAQVGPCAASFVTDAATFEEIEQSPYVVASQGPWAPGFEAAVRRTLVVAAGTGG